MDARGAAWWVPFLIEDTFQSLLESAFETMSEFIMTGATLLPPAFWRR